MRLRAVHRRERAFHGYTYTYDLNGNLASKTERATAQTTSYSYDALGRRIEKNSDSAIELLAREMTRDPRAVTCRRR